jgi:hypothetical protein
MLDGITLNWDDITGWGLAGLMVLLIIFGRLVPARIVRSIERERDHWRSTADTLRETNGVQARTIEKQLVIGDTVERVMSAVQATGAAGRSAPHSSEAE